MICVTHDRLLIEDWPGRVLRLSEAGLLTVNGTMNEGGN